MMVGFRARLAEELRHLLAEVPPYKERLSIEDVRLHSPPTKANYTCWTGASVFGATDAIITRYYYTFMLRVNLSSTHNVFEPLASLYSSGNNLRYPR